MNDSKNLKPKKKLQQYTVVTVYWKNKLYGFSYQQHSKQSIESHINLKCSNKFADLMTVSPSFVNRTEADQCVTISKDKVQELEKEIDEIIEISSNYNLSNIGMPWDQSMELFCDVYFLSRFVDCCFLENECNISGSININLREYLIKFTCIGCRKPSLDKMKKCGACKSKSIYFCSKECQIKNWKQHASDCEYTSPNKKQKTV